MASPLLVWSWRSLALASTWPTAARLRALALGHAIAERAGYRVVFYGDEPALRELDGLAWPWETRALPTTGADFVPEAFWSGTKLVALRDAIGREPACTPVVHVDHDGLVCGPLAELDDTAHLFAQNAQPLAPHARWYPAEMADAFGDELPSWWHDWRERGRIHECGLVGGSNRYAVEVFADEALRCASILDRRGTLERVHTWTLEQGIHAAIAEELGATVGFALDEEHRGPSYAAWPGIAKRTMPLGRLAHHLPPTLAGALARKLGPLPRAPITPYGEAI